MSDAEKPVSKSKAAWNEVGDKFSNLGDGFKSQYHSEDEEKPSGEAVKQAFEAVTESLEGFFSSLGSALKDEKVQQEAKSAASAVIDALGVTVEDVGVELKNIFNKDSSVVDGKPADAESQTSGAEAEEMIDAASEHLREDLDS